MKDSSPISAQDCAKQTIQRVLESNNDFCSQDFLRALQQQAQLVYEAEQVREQLRADPFENWKENNDLKRKVENLGKSLEVVDIHRVSTLSGYCFVNAVVELPVPSSKKGGDHVIQLTFRYEREAEQPKSASHRIEAGEDSPSVWYSIDASFGRVEPKERLLWV